MAHFRDRRAFGSVGTRRFRGARFGDALSPRFEGLLDLYPGAAAAYSLRALTSGWLAGDVVEVRRSSDSTTDTFTASQITNGDLVAFCGVGDGFVSTWYDQSGNGKDATQATTTAQPKIVDAGALVTGGLDFDGVDDQLDLSGTGLDIFKNVGYGQAFAVATSDETGLATANILGASTGLGVTRFLISESNVTAGSFRFGGRRLDADAFDSTTASVAHGNTEKLVTGFANWTDAEAYLYQNGSNVGTDLSFQTAGNTSNTSSTSLRVGFGNFDGRIREIIVYNTDQTANRVAIETNINDHYNIY